MNSHPIMAVVGAILDDKTMKFRWQGATYDTSEMDAFPTGNPAMPTVYLAPGTGGIFVLRIDRQEGAEVCRADADEAEAIARRYQIPQLAGPKPAEFPPHRDGQTEGCHALIVENDPASRHAVQRLLTVSGYNVACAATLAEAQMKLLLRPPCVMLDLDLPDGPGIELLRRIRTEKLPIRVAVLASPTEHALIRDANRLDPDALFHKPISIAHLLGWLEVAFAAPPAIRVCGIAQGLPRVFPAAA
jgi:CheY-like chemotaxis protein